ncbi:MAG: hypothetical protein AB7O92_11265 [Acidimicrobiia bacterium]
MSASGSRRAVAALTALVAVVAAGCSLVGRSTAGDAAVTTPPPTSASTTAAPAQPPRAPGVVHPVGISFQFQSFVITVGNAVYDQESGQLALGLRYANVSGGWAQTDTTATLTLGDGTSVPLSGDLFDVPPGAAVEVTSVAFNVRDDPVADGIVTWGGAAYEQPVFRLDGRGGEQLWLPSEIALDGWAQIGKFGIHLTGIQLNASKVDLGIQAERGTRVLRAFVEAYTARASTSPFDARSNLLLRLPSGEVLDAVDGSPMAAPLSWTAQGGQWADFVVPADVTGDYELLLASVPKVGFGTLQPELIERRAIPFQLDDVAPGTAPELDELPVPRASTGAGAGSGKPFSVALDAGSMNVPGYDVAPTRLAYDPATRSATLDATVTSLLTREGPDDALFSAPPTFGFKIALDAGGRLSTGLVRGDGIVEHDRPTPLRIEFTDVRSLSPAGAGLYIGPGEGAVASMPLGTASDVVTWPPPPTAQTVQASTATAGDWTVQVRAYRLGLLNPTLRPAVGRRQLELSLEVTASPDAQVRAFGLSFQPQYQVLLASGTGYDLAAVADSGNVELTPGQTITLSVIFEVPDTFGAGPLPLVVRSRAEFGDIPTYWIETRFLAQLTAEAATGEAF